MTIQWLWKSEVIKKITYKIEIEASHGAAAQSVTINPTGCGFEPHSRRWNIYLNVYFHFFALVSRSSAALSSVTQHAMPPELGRKWGTECLNIRFPLPTLLCAGYSVKLIYLIDLISPSMDRTHNRRVNKLMPLGHEGLNNYIHYF